MAKEQVLTAIGTIEQTGQPLKVTPSELFAQHLLVVGATGSGKSTSTVTLMTSLRKQNQTAVIIDPTGEYTHLPDAVVVKLGNGAFIDYTQLTAETLGPLLGLTSELALDKLTQAIVSLKIQQNVLQQSGVYQKLNRSVTDFQRDRQQLFDYPQAYAVELLPQQMQQECLTIYSDERADFDVLGQTIDQATFQQLLPEIQQLRSRLADPKLQALLRLPVYVEQTAELDQPTQYDVLFYMRLFSSMRAQQRCLVIDVSALVDQLRLGKLVVSLLTKSLLQVKRNLTTTVPVVLIVDEAHRYLTDAGVDQDGISHVAREGRKYGLYLMLTTQSPLDLPSQLLGQFGNWLVHRLNTATELRGVPNVASLAQAASQLPIGTAILTGASFTDPIQVKIQRVAAVEHQTASQKFL